MSNNGHCPRKATCGAAQVRVFRAGEESGTEWAGATPDGLGTPQCPAACDQETAVVTKPHHMCALGPSPHSKRLLGAQRKNERAVAFRDSEPDNCPPPSVRKRPELIRQVFLHWHLTERETEMF